MRNMPRLGWSLGLVLLALLLTPKGSCASSVGPGHLENPIDQEEMLKEELEKTRLEEIEANGNTDAAIYISGFTSNTVNDEKPRLTTTNAPFSGRTFTSVLAQGQRDTWGSHPIGTKDSFLIPAGNKDLKWIAYFYDQAIAAVLLASNGTMLKCTVQENIELWEQEAALKYLGEIMPLMPIAFDTMVHLVTLCGTLNIPPPGSSPNNAGSGLWFLDLFPIQGILPGTLWCGVRDRATYYRELGQKQKVDGCCRAHDHCPIKLRSLTSRYGVSNLGIKTLSHCTCDLEFYRCLKAANTETATMVGQVFFNILDMQCLDAPPSSKNKRKALPSGGSSSQGRAPDGAGRFECVKFDNEGGCRKWVLLPEDFSVELALSRLGLKF